MVASTVQANVSEISSAVLPSIMKIKVCQIHVLNGSYVSN